MGIHDPSPTPITRTRSNRAEKLAVQKLLSSGIPVNTRGLPALANELYLEILSHLPALPIPPDAWIDKKPDPYRQLTLYYLSQTCRSLRRFFLRCAWEQIEVFGGMWTPMGRLATTAERNNCGTDTRNLCEKRFVEETLRQLETVGVRNPDLRQYVSSVNITILNYSHDSVVLEIAQALSLFPNLHTLQLISRFYHTPPQPVFSAFRYPNVHTLNLCRMSPHVELLVACPNTKNFSFYKDDGEFHLPKLLTNECAGSIAKLGLLAGLEYHVAVMAKYLPRLCDLSLDCHSLRSGANYDSLSSLPLHTIRMRLDEGPRDFYRFIPATPDERRRWIDLAKGILANCPQHEAKRIIVVNDDKTVDVYSV